MNKFEEFKLKMHGAKVAVIGIGVSNTPLIKLLCNAGASVTAHDRKKYGELANAADLEQAGVQLKLGEEYLSGLDGFNYIFRSPGIRPDMPQLVQAQRAGAVLTSEMECFFEVCPCKIIAVTGSDGKTTTTTLIGKILEDAGYTCHIGGNIGKPLLAETDKIKPEDFAVVELSSFQLFTMKRSPSVAVVTNLSPNHLDIHKSMDEYKEAKENIFLHQGSDDLLILNADNQYTPEFAGLAHSHIVMFSGHKELNTGFYVKDNAVVYNDGNSEKCVVRLDDIMLPGAHNVENYMAAAAATMRFCSFENVKNVARTFGGVPHRIEFIRELGGVKYYNDSIASSPTRTIACLRSFKTPIILIAGGYDKHIPFEPLADEINLENSVVKEIILTGNTAEKIRAAIANSDNYDAERRPMCVCDTMEQALQTAKSHAVPGDNIILSPACASFDRYKNFEERGNIFKSLVNNL